MIESLGSKFSDCVLPEPNSGCWLWIGSLHESNGTGRFGKPLAHIIAYEAVIGPVPEGHFINQTCGLRNCVNPDHLQAAISHIRKPVKFWADSLRSIAPGRRGEPILDRFMRKIAIDRVSDCWNWTGGVNKSRKFDRRGNYKGYPVFDDSLGHRVSHEVFKGPILEGMEVDHLCRNTLCVNPDHLEAVTPPENKRRAKVTHCWRGHPFDEKNTWVEKNGYRHCRRCHADREAKKRQQRKN